jgi:hypothetical protein
MNFTNLTPSQQIERQYLSALDSVNLIIAGKPEYMTQADWSDTVQRNIDHLQGLIDSGKFSAEQVAVFQSAL